MRTIIEVQPKSDHKLRLRYADGASVEVDFESIIERGGVFTKLADASFFNRVEVGEKGRSICWPGEIDFCADALWIEGQKRKQER